VGRGTGQQAKGKVPRNCGNGKGCWCVVGSCVNGGGGVGYRWGGVLRGKCVVCHVGYVVVGQGR